MRKLDESLFAGAKYGKWHVLYATPNSYPAKLFCVCNCGTRRNVNRDSLIRGLSTGCRKCSGRAGSNNPAYRGTKNIPGNFWGILCKSAAARNIPVEVTIDDIDRLLEKQEFKCALTCLPISLIGGKKSWTASVDRIDSSLGYTNSNIQFVHKDVNLMKNRFDQDYFLSICRLVAAR